MVNSIEISIKSGINELLSAQILYNENICIKNNKKYVIDELFKKNVLRTICLWKNEYGNDNKIDTEEFYITVNSSDGKETIHGKGVFPNNYEYLIRLLGDLDD